MEPSGISVPDLKEVKIRFHLAQKGKKAGNHIRLGSFPLSQRPFFIQRFSITAVVAMTVNVYLPLLHLFPNELPKFSLRMIT
jgi:hypothetical protein